jgi:predicted nucleic acid-binding protein
VTGNIIIDTGPLVASFDRRDKYHEWARSQITTGAPLLTCEAVLTEACYLVRDLPGGVDKVLAAVRRGMLALPFSLETEASAVAELAARYANIPISLADACLVRMAELHTSHSVLTLDSDFKIYRIQRRHVIPTIVPIDR